MTEPINERRIGYCTNVHPGADLSGMLTNVGRCAALIRSSLAEDELLPIGLWLSRQALDDAGGLAPGQLRESLQKMGVMVFTLNGFPFGNFHGKRVKHDVYQPDWSRRERLRYTTDLADLLIDLIPEGATAGISTLPIGWSDIDDRGIEEAVSNLQQAVDHLARIESATGHCLHIDLEPEPGCLLQRSGDLVELFEKRLLNTANEARIRRHLRVCHDVCHAAVMFESQSEAIANYDSAGIRIGKIQVSTALEARGDDPRSTERLKAFAEPRWLHQVSIRNKDGIAFHEDLEQALLTESVKPDDCWRVHFHVPVHREHVESLPTTQDDLKEAIQLLAGRPEITDWEVETYAWNALPETPGIEELAMGIADEIRWTRRHVEAAS